MQMYQIKNKLTLSIEPFSLKSKRKLQLQLLLLYGIQRANIKSVSLSMQHTDP
jgi:hypothetical protein